MHIRSVYCCQFYQYIAAICLKKKKKKKKKNSYVMLSFIISGLSLLYGLPGFSPYAGYCRQGQSG